MNTIPTQDELLAILADQKAAFDRAAEVAKLKNEDKKERESDIAATLARAADQPADTDLATWAAYLIAAKRKLADVRATGKIELERLQEGLKASIEDTTSYGQQKVESVANAWQDLQEHIALHKDECGNLRQDIKEARAAIEKMVNGEEPPTFERRSD